MPAKTPPPGKIFRRRIIERILELINTKGYARVVISRQSWHFPCSVTNMVRSRAVGILKYEKTAPRLTTAGKPLPNSPAPQNPDGFLNCLRGRSRDHQRLELRGTISVHRRCERSRVHRPAHGRPLCRSGEANNPASLWNACSQAVGCIPAFDRAQVRSGAGARVARDLPSGTRACRLHPRLQHKTLGAVNHPFKAF